ncbi:MAG: hypothetical protein QNL91_15225 [Candidatus Krumholzibacteria bacterium]|nr:hypothetical protein [Candidatus Krumholzibacteria bacterium]
MRRVNIGGLIFLLLLVVAGCGDDDPVSLPPDPQPLGIMSVLAGAGATTVTDTIRFRISIGPDGGSRFDLVDLSLTNADSGTKIMLGAAESAGFDDAVVLLTNGISDDVEVSTQFPGGGGGETTNNEPGRFDGGILGEYLPDFAGAEITHVVLILDTVVIASPGGDPNGDGVWTDVFVFGRLVVMGHP